MVKNGIQIEPSKTVINFVSDAGAFCLLIEQHNTYSLMQFVEEIVVLLSSLVKSAWLLPELSVEVENEPSDAVDPKRAAEICKALGTKFGKYDTYQVTSNPYVDVTSEDKAVEYGVLGDDLADIYRELKNGLAMYEANSDLAVEHWKFTFEIHWGIHAVNALRTLHYVLTQHELILIEK